MQSDMFHVFVFHCQSFDSSYCFRQLISGTFVVFDVKIARSDCDAVFLPFHVSDILDAHKQIQIKSLAKVAIIPFSIAETTPTSVTVDEFIHASKQIKRCTLDRWLQHTSISEIKWKELIGNQNYIYLELQAIRNFLKVTSQDLVRAL